MGKMKAGNKQTIRWKLFLLVIVCLVLTASFFYLFYQQSLLPADYRRLGMPYGSDLPFHIKFAL